MEPALSKCLENPSVKDEVWDKCVRRSSVGIGLGTIAGAVSSIFFGTGGVIFSISMCATWALRHCRSLFREQEDMKKKTEQMKDKPPCTKETPKVCDVKPEVKKEEPEPAKPKKESCSSFPFQPVIPIPDRPFGRIDEGGKYECDCTIKETEKDLNVQCICPKPDKDGDKISDFYLECKDDKKTSDDAKAKGDGKQNIEEDMCTCQDGPGISYPPPAQNEPNCDCSFHSEEFTSKPTPPPPPPPPPAPPAPGDEECTCEPKCTCP